MSKVKDIIVELKKEKINTWFDLGLYIDRFRSSRKIPQARFVGSLPEFIEHIDTRGMAFLSYDYRIDGVSMEIEKYALCLRKIFPNATIHYIGGSFSFMEQLLFDNTKKYIDSDFRGFSQWKFYELFFFEKLERGSEKYNWLIKEFWAETLTIVEKLGDYIEKEEIKHLFTVNICSNPGNISLTLATILLAEKLGISVINNNHDFYWAEGKNEFERSKNSKNIKNKGLRDHFFCNYHIGEIFSIIEMLYPWESRSWINININKTQSQEIIQKKGHNPANVGEINTALDIDKFAPITKREEVNSINFIKSILGSHDGNLKIKTYNNIKNLLNADPKNPPLVKPFIMGYKNYNDFDFSYNNIIFLQPTRIIRRKKIEANFGMIKNLLEDGAYLERLKQNPILTITLMVTGPIADGHFSYFQQLLKEFYKLLESIEDKKRSCIFLAFLFSAFESNQKHHTISRKIGMAELYNMSSLVVLPSETEGRGLPILEACSCGIPVLCRRYKPEKVFVEVIGENLPESDRLEVLDFKEEKIPKELVKKTYNAIFSPKHQSTYITHNRMVIEKRYSLAKLKKDLEVIFFRLYLQLNTNENYLELAKKNLNTYKEMTNIANPDLEYLIDRKNKDYLPGYGRLRFMLYLKSLIDPSYFRVEEQQIRGMIMGFATRLLNYLQERLALSNENKIELPMVHEFYNIIDSIFYYHEGDTNIQHDHSFSYRRRNKLNYPYMDFTFQEMTGLVNYIYFRFLTTLNNPKKNNYKLLPIFL